MHLPSRLFLIFRASEKTRKPQGAAELAGAHFSHSPPMPTATVSAAISSFLSKFFLCGSQWQWRGMAVCVCIYVLSFCPVGLRWSTTLRECPLPACFIPEGESRWRRGGMLLVGASEWAEDKWEKEFAIGMWGRCRRVFWKMVGPTREWASSVAQWCRLDLWQWASPLFVLWPSEGESLDLEWLKFNHSLQICKPGKISGRKFLGVFCLFAFVFDNLP